MGPRPRGRGIRVPVNQIVTIDPLQWGRDRAVAEFGPNCPTIRFRFRVKGATARSRNFEWLLFGWRRADKLQWGRDRAVAELTMDAWDHGAVPRFNGAATARSRN